MHDKSNLQAEIFTRYITSKKHFSAEKNRVKHGAFTPNRKDGNLSVYRVKGLNRDEKLALGAKHIGDRMKAIAELDGNAFLNKGLKIDPNNTPERHADIYNWPKAKEDIKIIAIELAARATLALP